MNFPFSISEVTNLTPKILKINLCLSEGGGMIFLFFLTKEEGSKINNNVLT